MPTPSLFRRFSIAAVFVAVAALGTVLYATPDDEAKLRSTGKCAGCSLVDADLQGVQAKRADLSNADLSGANLYRASLEGADLSGANLNGANLSGANLRLAKGADLSSATTNEQTICPNGKSGPCK
jgi:uncharacterized protein YjbI with pentapeptide repeats